MAADGPVTLVDTAAAFEGLERAVSAATTIAFDIEFNGFHQYRERTCIVTFTLDNHVSFIVDSLAVWDDMPRLAAHFSSGKTKLLCHGGSYDVTSLKRDYGYTFTALDDTYLAATLLGYEAIGLASLVNKHFGVDLPKELQRHNWAERPLQPAHLAYLTGDTVWLVPLLAILMEQTAAADLGEEYRIECEMLAAQPAPTLNTPDPEGFRRLKFLKDLGDKGRGALKHLCLLRDQLAQSENIASFRVCSPDTLFRLARIGERGEWAALRGDPGGLHPRVRGQFIEALADAVARGLEDPQPLHPRRTGPREPMPSRQEMERQREVTKRLKAWRQSAAATRGIGIQAVLPTPVLDEIVRGSPATDAQLALLPRLGTRRLERYGHEILAIVSA
jgi:ribonuclease D